VLHEGRHFATVKTSGAIALTVYGATFLAGNKAFLRNCVYAKEDAIEFVKKGKSLFCKFVESAGEEVLPRGEVAVLDSKGQVIAVGRAVIAGRFMPEFTHGVAVKVREGSLRRSERRPRNEDETVRTDSRHDARCHAHAGGRRGSGLRTSGASSGRGRRCRPVEQRGGRASRGHHGPVVGSSTQSDLLQLRRARAGAAREWLFLRALGDDRRPDEPSQWSWRHGAQSQAKNRITG